jgi:hypothetical protein
MPFKLEKLPNEPTIISTVVDYNYETDGTQGAEDTEKLLEEQTEPVFVITNTLDAHMGLDAVIKGVNLSVRQFSLLKHPKVREGILVTQEAMMSLAAKGLTSPIFGKVKLKVCKTLEEALAYARNATSSGE